MEALSCDPAGTRTQGPNIKSVVLYQLSYEIKKIITTFYFWECKNTVLSPLSQNFLSLLENNIGFYIR